MRTNLLFEVTCFQNTLRDAILDNCVTAKAILPIGGYTLGRCECFCCTCGLKNWRVSNCLVVG